MIPSSPAAYRPHRPTQSPGTGVGGGPGLCHNQGGITTSPLVSGGGAGVGGGILVGGGPTGGGLLGNFFGSRRGKVPGPLSMTSPTPQSPSSPLMISSPPHYPAPEPPIPHPSSPSPCPSPSANLGHPDSVGVGGGGGMGGAPSKLQALHAQYCHSNSGGGGVNVTGHQQQQTPPPPYHHHHRYHMQNVPQHHPLTHRVSVPRRQGPSGCAPSHIQQHQRFQHGGVQHPRYNVGSGFITPPPLSPHSPVTPTTPRGLYHSHPAVGRPGGGTKLPLTISHSQPHPHAHTHSHNHAVHTHSPLSPSPSVSPSTHFIFSTPPPQTPSARLVTQTPPQPYAPQYPPLSSIPPPPPHSPLPPPSHAPLSPHPGVVGGQGGGTKSKPVSRISTVVWWNRRQGQWSATPRWATGGRRWEGAEEGGGEVEGKCRCIKVTTWPDGEHWERGRGNYSACVIFTSTSPAGRRTLYILKDECTVCWATCILWGKRFLPPGPLALRRKHCRVGEHLPIFPGPWTCL